VPRIAPTPIQPLFEHTQQALALVAENKGLNLRIRPSGAWVSCDRDMLQRILLNLVGNALRYTRAGGVLLACRRRGDHWVVEVWDTGNGIPENARDVIFDEYTQLENPERDRAKGLGLGLAICRRLAGLLGAPIGLRSRPGRGSVFWVRLPATAEPDVAAQFTAIGDSPDDVARLGGTVLVVDGDPLVRAGMETAISGWGANVILAAGGEEAWRCCEGGMRPDMAICNLGLPGRESGYGTGARAASVIYPAMGVLLVSADISEEAQAAARSAGFPLLKQPLPPAACARRCVPCCRLRPRRRASRPRRRQSSSVKPDWFIE
jgi:CheY-like chemotaxis protein